MASLPLMTPAGSRILLHPSAFAAHQAQHVDGVGADELLGLAALLAFRALMLLPASKREGVLSRP